MTASRSLAEVPVNLEILPQWVFRDLISSDHVEQDTIGCKKKTELVLNELFHCYNVIDYCVMLSYTSIVYVQNITGNKRLNLEAPILADV